MRQFPAGMRKRPAAVARREAIIGLHTTAMCWLLLGTVLAFAQATEKGRLELQGIWIATSAERDGKSADDVIGHRLSFTENRFQIHAKDGRSLYAGTIQINPSVNPAAIDFEHTQGPLTGKVWKGIFTVEAETLTTCDNAPDLAKSRPTTFEATSGSGYVLIRFKRTGR